MFGGDGGQVPTVMTARVKASTVMRTFEERVILQAYRQQTVVLELQVNVYLSDEQYQKIRVVNVMVI